ncbi:MAG: hypothetical protein QOK03_59, partial [Candidatus Binataceae bacterium]|nr:hypothetical protein [Candidatus Binataceae bacterium]
PSRAIVGLHPIGDRRDAHHRSLVVAAHTADTSALRLMT